MNTPTLTGQNLPGKRYVRQILTNASAFLIFVFLSCFNAYSADYRWVGGNNNNDWETAANWLCTSCGGTVNAVPTIEDNVLFDFNGIYTQPVMINATAECANMVWDNSWPGGITPEFKSLNSSTTLTVTGSLTFAPNMLVNLHSRTRIYFRYGTAAPRTITSSGHTFPGLVYFDELDGDWTLLDDFDASYIVFMNRGVLHFSNTVSPAQNNVKIYTFRSLVNAPRTLDLQNTNMEITGFNVAFDVNHSANVTLQKTNSIIRFTNTAHPTIMQVDDLSFGDVMFEADVHGELDADGNTFDKLINNGELTITHENTATNLILNGGSKTILRAGHTQTIGSLVTAATCPEQISIQSTWSGTDATLDWSSSATTTLQRTFIEDVELTSFTGTLNGTYYNLTNSAGWGSPAYTGSTFYWIGNSGSWNDPGNWSVNLGGPNGCLPTPIDDVIFNAASFAGGTPQVEVDAPNVYCKDMQWFGGWAGVPDFTSNDTKNSVNVFGSFKLQSIAFQSFSYDANLVFRSHTTGNTLDLDDQTMECDMYFDGSNGEWRLLTPIVSTGSVNVEGGTFKSDGQDIDAFEFTSIPRNTRTIELGDGGSNHSVVTVERWNLNSAPDVNGSLQYNQKDPFLTFDAQQSIINVETTFARCGIEEVYNVMKMNNASGSQDIWAKRCEFNRLELYGDVDLGSPSGGLNGMKINDYILLSAGKSYDINGEVILTAASSDIIANGDCVAFINIENGSFTKDNGTLADSIHVSYCIITDNDANSAAGVPFNTSFSLLNNANGWSPSSVSGVDFHFKGTTDNLWSNGDNWYTDNNFTTTHGGCIPGPFDDVFIHYNSFSAHSDLKVEANNAYCKSMTWEPAGTYPAGTEFLGSNVGPYSNTQQLNIFGSLSLLPAPQMDWDYNGTVRFRSHADTCFTEQILSEGQLFKNFVKIEINQGCKLEMADDMAFDQTSTKSILQLISGYFDLLDHDLTTWGLYLDATAEQRTFDAENSTIFVGSTYKANATNLTLIATGSTIDMGTSTGSFSFFNSSGLSYENVNFHSGYGDINGSLNDFYNVEFFKDGNFKGSNSFEILTLTPDKTYKFKQGTTQTITNNTGNGALNAIGSNGSMIIMESDFQGQPADIYSYVPVCLDYVQMRDLEGDLHASPQSLVAGANSINVADNAGWSFYGCDPIIVEGCVGEAILFDQFLNGNPIWNFDDGTIVNQAGPTHIYLAAGTYNVVVTFDVFGNTGLPTTDGRNFQVLISQSCCDVADFPSHTLVQGDITSNTVWGDQILVEADVFVKAGAKLDITNSDVVFLDGTGIYVEEDSRLIVTNSTLRPCDESSSWSGIDFDGSSTGFLTDNTFIQPVVGVELNTTGTVDVNGNQFQNFYTGVYVGNSNSTMLDHMITGNDFTLNRYVDGISYPTDDFYGVHLDGAWIEPSISLNDFHYTYLASSGKNGVGVYNNGGAATVSDNDFTNVNQPLLQILSSNVTAFDNNVVNYNNEFGFGGGSPTTVGVTIESNGIASSVSNNRFVMSSSSISTSSAVYVNESSEVLVIQNNVDGFLIGVQFTLSNGEVINNTINACNIGLSGEWSTYMNVKENTITESTGAGISMQDCVEEIFIRGNVIENQLGVPAFGIAYYISENGASDMVEITGNCVLDCVTSMAFIAVEECAELPMIRNNYLYNYQFIGIEVDNFQGDIGQSTSDPGKNSFISNHSSAVDFVNNTDPGCVVNLQHNWPDNISYQFPSGSGFIPQPGYQNSTAACGRQTPGLKLAVSRDMSDYLMEQYQVDIVLGEVSVSEATYSAIAEKGEVAQFAMVNSIMQLLLANDDLTAAENFKLTASQRFSLTAGQTAWMDYKLAFAKGDMTTARASLASANDPSLDQAHLSATAFMLDVYADGRGIHELKADEQAVLNTLYLETESPVVRSLMHQSAGEHPYEYVYPAFNRTPQGATAPAELGSDDVTIYPNPSSDRMNVLLNVELPEGATVEVTDLYGKVLSTSVIGNYERTMELPVSELSNGMYFISIHGSAQTWRLPFEVMH